MPPRRRGALVAWIGLLLTAATPPPPATEVQHVPPEQASAILGEKVVDPEGKEIGRLVDILVGQDGQPQAGVIDFGGFMGVGSRKIAVQWSTLHFTPADTTQPIMLELTPDQIKAAPEYKGVARSAPVVVTAPARADDAAPEASSPKQ
jgi:PRC-barrel domain protein